MNGDDVIIIVIPSALAELFTINDTSTDISVKTLRVELEKSIGFSDRKRNPGDWLPRPH